MLVQMDYKLNSENLHYYLQYLDLWRKSFDGV